VRCAIYTRKSSEEGLEQEFNSLDAQREACEAYIKSQAEMGWRTMSERYDDGGISGGTLERPALTRLLTALEAKRVDIIVIYRIDRLTRSLTDFGKLAERFDELKVSFVSVTQQFNTATSMGRLMLNVLLSFAQFEREITGERIRDKIRASKQKGMWMGGMVPLGYDLADRLLLINPAEARTVRQLYEMYLEAGSITALYRQAEAAGLRTKTRVREDGTSVGNRLLSRGHLHRILSNPLYCGEIVHKGKRYPGLHERIVGPTIWDRVQSSLEKNRTGCRYRKTAQHTSLLTGILFDDSGDRYVPSHTSRDKKRYRYYVRAPRDDKDATHGPGSRRLPALEIEKPVKTALLDVLLSRKRISEIIGEKLPATELRCLIKKAKELAARLENASTGDWREALSGLLEKVTLGTGRIRIKISRPGFGARLGQVINSEAFDDKYWYCEYPYKVRNRGRQLRIVPEGMNRAATPEPDPALLKLLLRAHDWRRQLETGQPRSIKDLAAINAVNASYFTRVLRLAYLAPDIVEAIVVGRQPPDLSANQLVRRLDLPTNWASQREYLGFPEA
jgi:DNA invertase Pin-like site-specific DNA recombinase